MSFGVDSQNTYCDFSVASRYISEGRVRVRISNKMLKTRFLCCYDYIINTCHGQCCTLTEGLDTMMTLLPEEAEHHISFGFPTIVSNGCVSVKFDKATTRCCNLGDTGLCALYSVGRPFGCVVAPVAFNKANTLIISNRFRLFKCRVRNAEDGGVPAYVAFRSSLDLLLGEEESARVCAFLDSSELDLEAWVDKQRFEDLKFIDSRYIATKRIKKV